MKTKSHTPADRVRLFTYNLIFACVQISLYKHQRVEVYVYTFFVINGMYEYIVFCMFLPRHTIQPPKLSHNNSSTVAETLFNVSQR